METPKDGYNVLKKAIQHLKKTSETGLTFQKLYLPSTGLLLLTDVSFRNARELERKLGYVLLMSDNQGTRNIVQYGSNHCRRVSRSVLASEIIALVLGFDKAFLMWHLLQEILGRRVELLVHVDSRAVCDVLAKDVQTSERRFQVKICALRESYENGILPNLVGFRE